MSTRFDEEECIVVEVRPPGDTYFWQEWLADRLGWILLDGQHIKPAPLTEDEIRSSSSSTNKVAVKTRDTNPYAKLVYRGEKHSILKVWRSKPIGMQVVFQGVMISIRPVGIGQYTPTQFGPSGISATHDVPDAIEFDMNEDNNAIQMKRDLGRKLSIDECTMLDVIDELGDLLPLAQKTFEIHAGTIDHSSSTACTSTPKSAAKGIDRITPYACCKAIGSLLRINVTVEELLLDDSNNIQELQVHSALTRIDEHTDPPKNQRSGRKGGSLLVTNVAHLALGFNSGAGNFPQPTITYVNFLYILLRLKRRKEEDPSIVSPRASPRGSAKSGTGVGKALGGDGDTFGMGAGIHQRELLQSPRSPRNTIYSPRTSMMLANAGPSGGVASPRPYPSLSSSAASRVATLETKPATDFKPFSLNTSIKTNISAVPDIDPPRPDEYHASPKPEPLRQAASPAVKAHVDGGAEAKATDIDLNTTIISERRAQILVHVPTDSLWTAVNRAAKSATDCAVIPDERSYQRSKTDKGKDDPRLDAMRRHRIAALERRPSAADAVHTVFDDNRSKEKSSSLSMPNFNSTPPPLIPQQTATFGTTSQVGSSDSMLNFQGNRLLPLGRFPLPASSVEPRLWFISLNFYEKLSRLSSMFLPMRSGGTSKNRDRGEVSGESPSSSDPVDNDEEEERTGNDLSCLSAVELNTTSRAYRTVRRAFQSCDTNNFYTENNCDSDRQANDLAVGGGEVLLSDLSTIMMALNIHAKVVIPETNPGSNIHSIRQISGSNRGSANIISAIDFEEDMDRGTHAHNNPTPVQLNLESRRTETDPITGLRTGTGTVLWTCLPAWWNEHWDRYLASRKALKKDFEKKVRRFRNCASQRKLTSAEIARFHTITDIVQKLTAELAYFTTPFGESTASTGIDETIQPPVLRLSWDTFVRYLRGVVEDANTNVNALRRLISVDIWKNARNAAFTAAVSHLAAKKLQEKNHFQWTFRKKIDRKDRDFTVQKNLFVGYFPKTVAEEKAELETAALESERVKKNDAENQENPVVSESVHLEKELVSAQVSTAHSIPSSALVTQSSVGDAGADLDIDSKVLQTTILETGVTPASAEAVTIETPSEALIPETSQEQVSIAADVQHNASSTITASSQLSARQRFKLANTSQQSQQKQHNNIQSSDTQASSIQYADNSKSSQPSVVPTPSLASDQDATSLHQPQITSQPPTKALAPMSARDRFKKAQEEKERVRKQEEEAAVADMLAMAKAAEESPHKGDAPDPIVKTASSPLSARQRFKMAQAAQLAPKPSKDTDEVEEELD